MYRVMANIRSVTIIAGEFEKRFDAKEFSSTPQIIRSPFGEEVQYVVHPENMFIKEVNCKNLGRTDPFAEDDIEMPF